MKKKVTFESVLGDVPEGPKRDFLRLMIKTGKFTPEYLWMFEYQALHRRTPAIAVDIMNEMVRRRPERFGVEVYITEAEMEAYWKELGL